MKRGFLFVAFLLLSTAAFALEYEIWGVWNSEGTELSSRPTELSNGVFLRSFGETSFLLFHEYFGGGHAISYQGGYYDIKTILSHENSASEVSFYLETKTTVVADSHFKTVFVSGKITMHFIDADHMWLEIVYGDKDYPTDSDFPTIDFKGRDTVFSRGGRVEEYGVIYNAVVNDNRVHVRESPFLVGFVEGFVNKGDAVQVFGRTEHKQKIDGMESYWYLVKTATRFVTDDIDRYWGWVYGAYLDIKK